MDKKSFELAGRENTDLICEKINQEAEEEIKIILDKARLEAGNILVQAQREAESKKELILNELERDIQKSKEKIFSSLNLEKKRLVLTEKEMFVHAVLAELDKDFEEFRETGDYLDFLKKAVIEGIKVIGQNSAVIYYSFMDARYFSETFLAEVRKLCLEAGCAVKFNKAEFEDLGVIINSIDGRVMYDNRLSSRLARNKEEISGELLKKAF